MKKTVWVSFDLGIRGDYEGMYIFLANANAQECGNNVGVFTFESQGDLLDDLRKAIVTHVKIDDRSRIYVSYKKDDGKLGGKFIVGKRKAPPWTGYNTVGVEMEDTSE